MWSSAVSELQGKCPEECRCAREGRLRHEPQQAERVAGPDRRRDQPDDGGLRLSVEVGESMWVLWIFQPVMKGDFCQSSAHAEKVLSSLLIRAQQGTQNVVNMRTAILLVLLIQIQLSSGLFKVVGQNYPVLAAVGTDIILHFKLESNTLPENVEISWENTQANKIVNYYRDNREQTEQQDEYYKYRSEIFQDEITKGNISLKLKNIRLSDDGIYRCLVKTETYFDTAFVSVEVGSVGIQPVMIIESVREDGISIICTSSGWFPKPNLVWTDNFGKDLTGSSRTSSEQNGNGLIMIESHLQLPKLTDIFSCTIYNTMMQKEKVAKIKFSASLATQHKEVSVWAIAFGVSSFIVLILAGIMYQLKKKLRKKESALKELDRLCVAVQDYTLPEEDELKMKVGDFIEIIEKRDSWYKGRNKGHEGLFPSNYVREMSGSVSEIKMISPYPVSNEDWESIQKCRVSVTLDPETAHPKLILSDDNTSVTCSESMQEVPHSPKRFQLHPLVLGSISFSSGKHYWEVEVTNKIKWTLGLAKASVNENENVTCLPDHGYWVIMLRNGNKYDACEKCPLTLDLPKQPTSIGIFLDFEGGSISFYDPFERSHIYTFNYRFTEPLYPYFNPCLPEGGINSAPLKICKVDQ